MMPAAAVLSAFLVIVGIGLVGAALSRWGRAGIPQRRVGALVLIGLAALLAGATVMAEGATAFYIVSAIIALAGLLMLATRGAREQERSLPKLKRRR